MEPGAYKKETVQAGQPKPKKPWADMAAIIGLMVVLTGFLGVLVFFLHRGGRHHAKEDPPASAAPAAPKVVQVDPEKTGDENAIPDTAAQAGLKVVPIKNTVNSTAAERELAHVVPHNLYLESVQYENAVIVADRAKALGKQILLKGFIVGKPDDASSTLHNFRYEVQALKLFRDIATKVEQKEAVWNKQLGGINFTVGIELKPGYAITKFDGMPSLLPKKKKEPNGESAAADDTAGQSTGEKTAAGNGQPAATKPNGEKPVAGITVDQKPKPAVKIDDTALLEAVVQKKLNKARITATPDGKLQLVVGPSKFGQGESFNVKSGGQTCVVTVENITADTYKLRSGNTSKLVKLGE